MECSVSTELDGARQTVLLFVSQCSIVRKVRACNGACNKN
jgi:hypothetical protein